MDANAFTWIVFAVSVLLTGWHLFEEHQGKLWRYFGAIAGVRIADGVGRLLFTIILGAILIAAAVFGILGIGGQGVNVASWFSMLGIGFLIGGRISDWWNSHVGKLRMGYKGNRGFRGNPGLLSSWFYWIDVILLIALLISFSEVWNTDQGWEPILGLLGGLVVGGGLFFIVIGAIKRIGKKLFSGSQEIPWKRNDPIPDWAR